MSAPIAVGSCCSSAPLRTDPQTGETRCSGCGMRPETLVGICRHSPACEPQGGRACRDFPPPILGGQGRDAGEVEADGDSLVRLLIVACVLAAVFAVGAWAAGGGR